MKINRDRYLDKVRACWVGKNIGGTMGMPYEANTEMQDIHGFNSPKGEPLPNDDLDLQLIWLCAIEERGIRNITPQILGEYWINYITPPWSEYGVCKANMRLEMQPPYAGEYKNEIMRNSNGAWIRTELWACLFPGFPELAVKFAYRDACVDHGMGEGTYAAMFVAAMESAAFFENDFRKLVETGLSYIPKESRTAKSVRLAVKLYDKGTDFKDARNAVVAETADLGWFQAPANVSFVILGFLYGEGDYKKSMIHAINCGDDTDCTGATIGSLMGIMYGSKSVPEDWAEYIGDRIISMAVDLSYTPRPATLTDLTKRVYELTPSCLKAYEIYAEYTDGETERDELPEYPRMPDFDIPETGLSFDFPDMGYAKGRVEFDKCSVKPGDEIKLKFIFKNTIPDPNPINIELILPEGWTADRKKFNMYLRQMFHYKTDEDEVTVTAGEGVEGINKIYIRISAIARPSEITTPLIIMGK